MMCDMLPEELLRTKSKGTKLEEEGTIKMVTHNCNKEASVQAYPCSLE